MGTVEVSKFAFKPVQKSSGSESPSRVIFNYAYRRIWSGNGLWIFETVLWCLAGAYVAFWIFDLTSYLLDSILESVCRGGLPALTPIIIGIAIYKAQVNIGTGDESLRGVPLRGYQVVGPRFLAVFLTWLQIMAPMVVVLIVIILGMISETTYFSYNPIPVFSMSYIFITWIAGDNIFANISNSVHTGEITPVVILFLQALGWGLVPISWGLIWATVYQRHGGPFLLAFLLYLLIPAVYFSAIYWNVFGSYYEDQSLFWTLVYIYVFGFLLLAALFFRIACTLWDRRSG